MQHMRSQDSVWCGKACSSLATLNGCHADGVIGLQSVWESFSEALLHWHAGSVIGLQSVWESFSRSFVTLDQCPCELVDRAPVAILCHMGGSPASLLC